MGMKNGDGDKEVITTENYYENGFIEWTNETI